MCKRDGANLRQTFVSSNNPRQNIWHKLKKYFKIGEDFQM